MSERSFQSFFANGADIYSKLAKYAWYFPKTFCRHKSVFGDFVPTSHSFFHLWTDVWKFSGSCLIVVWKVNEWTTRKYQGPRNFFAPHISLHNIFKQHFLNQIFWIHNSFVPENYMTLKYFHSKYFDTKFFWTNTLFFY